MFYLQDFFFSSLLLCNKPSPNLWPKRQIYFARESAIWADTLFSDPLGVGKGSSEAGVENHLEIHSLPGMGLMLADAWPLLGAVG